MRDQAMHGHLKAAVAAFVSELDLDAANTVRAELALALADAIESVGKPYAVAGLAAQLRGVLTDLEPSSEDEANDAEQRLERVRASALVKLRGIAE
jgi:hypothetical protein